jgi:actin-related protein
MWITRKEYEENQESIVHRKCFWAFIIHL